jgi:hypothetical protein
MRRHGDGVAREGVGFAEVPREAAEYEAGLGWRGHVSIWVETVKSIGWLVVLEYRCFS